jgi:hypothetical protein
LSAIGVERLQSGVISMRGLMATTIAAYTPHRTIEKRNLIMQSGVNFQYATLFVYTAIVFIYLWFKYEKGKSTGWKEFFRFFLFLTPAGIIPIILLMLIPAIITKDAIESFYVSTYKAPLFMRDYHEGAKHADENGYDKTGYCGDFSPSMRLQSSQLSH